MMISYDLISDFFCIQDQLLKLERPIMHMPSTYPCHDGRIQTRCHWSFLVSRLSTEGKVLIPIVMIRRYEQYLLKKSGGNDDQGGLASVFLVELGWVHRHSSDHLHSFAYDRINNFSAHESFKEHT